MLSHLEAPRVVLGLAAAARGREGWRGREPKLRSTRVDRNENVGEEVADRGHGGDDDNGDQSGDETIFDGVTPD